MSTTPKRPEKITLSSKSPLKTKKLVYPWQEAMIYNQACNDWEAWLPSEGELMELIRDTGAKEGLPLLLSERLTTALHARLRGTS